MDLETSRTLGGIGALLMFIGPIVGMYTGILGLIGLILALIGLKGLADNYNEQRIFNNALYGVLTIIVGAVISIAIIVIAAFGLFAALGIDLSDLASMQATFQQIDWVAIMDWSIIWPYVAAILASLIVFFVFIIVMALFLRTSLNFLSAKSKVGLFSTTGLILLIGAALTIIAIGLLLIWVDLLILAVAFFSIRPAPAQPAATMAPQPPPPAQ